MIRICLVRFIAILLIVSVFHDRLDAAADADVPDDVSATDPEQNPQTPDRETLPPQQRWYAVSSGDLRADVTRWLDTLRLAPEQREAVLRLWVRSEAETHVSSEILADRFVLSMRLACEEAAEFLRTCDEIEWNELPFGETLRIPDLPESLLASEERFPRLIGGLRMYLVQCLIRVHYYDQAFELLREMNPDNAIDPAAVLYARGVAANALSRKEEGLPAIQELRERFLAPSSDSSSSDATDVEHPESSMNRHSRRLAEVAKLVENELESIADQDEQPSNISRKMDDISRRLGLGQTGENVQDVEKNVLDSLDKLIEKVEQQRKKQARSGSGGQGRRPGDEERIMRQKGPGNVADKRIGSESGWGKLPPKEREAALMQIEKEFPSHYREIIEQYFRQMAGQED